MRKVFEINRNFRNEGLSPRHNPEFTMLEAYEAFGNWETMAELVEDMVCTVAEKVCGGLILNHGGAESAEDTQGEPASGGSAGGISPTIPGQSLLGEGFALQLVEEFFNAVANAAAMNLHIETPWGRNNHHLAEAIFKAFGRALRQAVCITGDEVPSTKGSL